MSQSQKQSSDNFSQKQLLGDIGLVLQLKDHVGWQIIMRDAQANFDALSLSWFELEEGSPELRQHRARQIANYTILTLMDQYEARFKELGLELIHNDNTDTLQTSDIDRTDVMVEEDNDE